MNFETFQQSQKYGNLVELLGDIVEPENENVSGWVYLDSYFIENTRTWSWGFSGYEDYYLCIGNEEHFSNDVEELEEILFEFIDN